jgi:ubiquinol-cytochrome c reductase cytochrome c1 subunit
MKKLIATILLVLAPTLVWAAGATVKLDQAPIDPTSVTSLQSGARTFVNYCLNCHSANLVRYNQLKLIGLTDAQIRDNLLFTGEKVGEMMKIAAPPADQRAWFGAPPPDLSVIARSRGVDWLYTYMKSFYRDPSTPTGWNNTVFPNVGMPHVLWTLQGTRGFEATKEDDGHGHMVTKINMLAPEGGSQNTVEYNRTVTDLVNFLSWMGEPHQLERKRIGYYVLSFLFVLMLFAYLLKAAYWRDVH